MLLDTIALDYITIKQVSKSVGVGAFSRFPSHSGQVIYKDLPLVSIQHTANRRFIRACQHCHSPIGSVKEQFELIFNEDRYNHIDLTGLPVFDSSIYSCACGESYCSTSCASEAYKRHHYCLCVNASGEHSSAVSEFKFYCLSIDGCGDNLLLLAQLLATVASISEGQFPKFQEMISELLTFTNRPFDEVARPPCGFERDAEWQAWLESTISEAFELLFRALSGQSAVFAQFFSHKQEAFNTLSRLLSVFELNNIDISIPSSLGERVRNLCQKGFVIEPILREKEVVMRALWNDEAKGVYEDSDFGDEILEESEGIEIDECHSDGTGCVDDLLEIIREDVNLMTKFLFIGGTNESFL